MRKSGACSADMQKAIKKAMQNNAWLFPQRTPAKWWFGVNFLKLPGRPLQ
jgi:hypothetical protein